MKKIARLVAIGLLVLVVVVSIVVELESRSRLEELGGIGPDKALVLYHPSREARFSDAISLAVAEGLMTEGYLVHRATLTEDAPEPTSYALIAVVSNTYWWTPDLPTLRYLKRARFNGRAAVGVMTGAGSTGRAQRMLEERLTAAGATVVGTRSFWLWRPNDERRTDVSNRQVAIEQARQMGMEFGRAVLIGHILPPQGTPKPKP